MIIRLAWRNIWRNKRRTIITISSISMGLFFAIFFICMAEGVYKQLIEDGVKIQAGHVTIEHKAFRDAPAVDLYVPDIRPLKDTIDHFDFIRSTKCLVLGQGIARSGNGTVSVAVMGVEPRAERKTSPLAAKIIQGRYLEENDRAKVVVGKKLADRLHLQEGKKLVLTTNDVNGALTEELCRVVGIYESGAEEIDGYLIQTPITFLRKLYGMPENSVTQLAVILDHPDDQKKAIRRIRPILPEDSAVYPWQKILPELDSYIKLDKGSNWIFQAILIFLILFTIFNTILMSVLERKKEFAVVMALGTTPFLLKCQLFAETSFIGLIGCMIGIVTGGMASYALYRWGFDISRFTSEGMNVSGFAVSPVIRADVSMELLLGIGLLVYGVTVLLSLFPMRKVSKIHIADTLR